ncbi:hypothetical protein BO86DRAFT_197909 [Aspergillus japonicus CBS 114.51]|uniref:Uncharacterized protein n=1 Tax=Aspergillus japonicus CBS 114.51 TaxID=1448312 RepID=A0A8T8WQN3_ASPJA|nr:hypothetical protein BO86DRAFT_197909 [Aspergillus japonicus CBS 114.51]RAH78148.1 hypothetical protein BO86DRAFT_197909 [Aspergillus japonicus CBS 114.51]
MRRMKDRREEERERDERGMREGNGSISRREGREGGKMWKPPPPSHVQYFHFSTTHSLTYHYPLTEAQILRSSAIIPKSNWAGPPNVSRILADRRNSQAIISHGERKDALYSGPTNRDESTIVKTASMLGRRQRTGTRCSNYRMMCFT